ncbi:hypothetical protein FGO68_gene13713 [Halteria grandinella]|uniref:TRP C-terminal domain-containing protein n=1 Tax=Halteria grandinella TaxID=5974 RepID=A0A8J8T9Y4_HALGN|nr:hypothetical protein FGO68_gene13713 [Halteria grandinella]
MPTDIQLRDIYYDSTELDVFSILIENQRDVQFGRMYLFNSTLVSWVQLPRQDQWAFSVLGRFLTIDTYLFGFNGYGNFTPNDAGLKQQMTNGIQNGVIMSNTQSDSCYFIKTANFELFFFSSTLPLVQATQSTNISYFTVRTPYSPSLQNLDISKLTSISSWCPNKDKSFTFDASIPNIFYVNYGNTNISLDFLQYCGAPIPTSPIFSLIDTVEGIRLIPNEPILEITTLLTAGNYSGKAAATKLTEQAILNFTIVVNMPPQFSSTLQNIIANKGSPNPIIYTLPEIQDYENNECTINIELVSINSTNTSQTCIGPIEAKADTGVIVFDYNTRSFTVDVADPALLDQWICDFYYNITIIDSLGATSPIYEFTISIILGNMPPYWVYDPPEAVLLHLGEIITVDLPLNLDPNGDTITYIPISSPSYAVINPSSFQYTLAPKLKEHIGFAQITGNLTDGQTPPENLSFSINVTVVNFAPRFAEELTNKTQIVEEFQEYQLPSIIDQESTATDPISIQLCVIQNGSNCNETLPEYITFVREQTLFLFKGVKSNQGIYTIQIRLEDSVGNFSISSFTLSITENNITIIEPNATITEPNITITEPNITITEHTLSRRVQLLSSFLFNTGPPEFLTPFPSILIIEERTSQSLKLPPITDPDSDQFEVHVYLGTAATFVKFKNSALIISPFSQHVAEKPYPVLIELKDNNKSLRKSRKYKIGISVTAIQKNATSTASQYYIEEIDEAIPLDANLTGNYQYIVRMRLLQVTNLGRARIRVYSKNSRKLMQMITNSTFMVKMKGQEATEEVPYTVESREASILVLKLYFSNPQAISQSQSFDKLFITTRYQLKIVTYYYNETLLLGTSLQTFIPIQLSEEEVSRLVLIQKVIEFASYALVSSNLFLNFFLQVIKSLTNYSSGILSYLFGLLNDISQVTMLSLININIPGSASYLTSIIMKLVYMDLLQTDLWINNIIDLDSPDDDALCPSFYLAGYSSQFTISNLGSTFVFLFLLICCQAILFVIMIGASILPIAWQVQQTLKFKNRLKELCVKVKKLFYWNSLMRFFIQQFQTILTASLICVYLNLNGFNLTYSQFLERTDSTASKISVYLGLVLLLGSIIAPIAMAKIVYSNQRDGSLMTPQFQERYGTLFDGLNIASNKGLVPYWNVITLFRWGIQISMFVFLKDAPTAQIVINLIMSQLFTILVAHLRPFASGYASWIKVDPNNFKVLNEILVTYYLIFMLILTDVTSDIDIRENFGIGELVIIGLCVLSNLLKASLEGINELMRRKDLMRRKTLIPLKHPPPPSNHPTISISQTFTDLSHDLPDTFISAKPKKKKKIRLVIAAPAETDKQWQAYRMGDEALEFHTNVEAYNIPA